MVTFERQAGHLITEGQIFETSIFLEVWPDGEWKPPGDDVVQPGWAYTENQLPHGQSTWLTVPKR